MRKSFAIKLAGGLLASLIFAAFAPAQLSSGPSKALGAGTTLSAKAGPQDLITEFEVNGLKVLVKRRSGSQSVVAGLFIKGGARNVTAENTGIEALMLESATEASQKYPLALMRRELSRTGTSITYGINMDYSVLSAASTKRYFDRSWDVFADVALHPTFAPDDVDRSKNRLAVSLADNEDTPDSFLQLLQAKAAYLGHPYLNDPHGTAASVSRLTAAQVTAYHQQVMQTSRLLLIVVGDVDPQDIKRKVEASLAKLPKGEYRPAPVPQLAFTTPTLAVTERRLPTNYIQGIFSAPPITSPEIYAMRVAMAILQSRVYSEVRVRRNLSYAPDAFLWSQAANAGGIYVTAVDANRAVGVMLDEIAQLQTREIAQEEIDATAQGFLTRYYLGQETNAAQAGELAQFELIGGGWRNSAEFLTRIRAVTPKDVMAVSKKYMKNLNFVVIGDPAKIDRSIFLSQK